MIVFPLRPTIASAVVVLLLPMAASADVAITWQRFAGGEGAAAATIVETIAGMKQREDHSSAGRGLYFSAIRDLTVPQEHLLWHDLKMRQTEALLPAPEAGSGRKGLLTASEKEDAKRHEAIARRLEQAEGKATGRTETILGAVCREYRFVAVAYDSKFVVTGTYWLPERDAGAGEFAAFYERLQQLEFVKEPKVSRGTRRTMRGRLELQREFLAAARRRGIPYRYEYEVTGSGLVPIRVRQAATAISAENVPAVLFEVPKDYRPR